MDVSVTSGFKFDPQRFTREMARRGLTGDRLSELSGIDRSTVSRARRGRQVRPETFHKLIEALLTQPIIRGAELLA